MPLPVAACRVPGGCGVPRRRVASPAGRHGLCGRRGPRERRKRNVCAVTRRSGHRQTVGRSVLKVTLFQDANQEVHMRKVYGMLFVLGAVALMALTPPAVSAAQSLSGKAGSVSAPALPTVTLKMWQNSTTQERRAFLLGFMSMLELEHAWQGKSAMPIEQSTVSTWVRGLAGVSIPDMDNALNAYIAQRPKAVDRSVLEVLGRIYVRPKLSQKERDDAAKRVDVLKADYPR